MAGTTRKYPDITDDDDLTPEQRSRERDRTGMGPSGDPKKAGDINPESGEVWTSEKA